MTCVKKSKYSESWKTRNSVEISNFLESDLNLLECLMTGLILPQDLVDQFPEKLRESLRTGVTWFKHRTFEVKNWRTLFKKFQPCLSKTELSIITNKESYLKYIMKQYENCKILKKCGENKYIVEKAFFNIYKQKVQENRQKIEHFSDNLSRNSGSVELLRDFQRRSQEKRKCLEVVRHIFEQGCTKENNIKDKEKKDSLKVKKESRIVNMEFDFSVLNLPKLNIDSCVLLKNINKPEVLVVKKNHHALKKTEDFVYSKNLIDFKKIISDITIFSRYSNSIVELVRHSNDENETINGEIIDVTGDSEKAEGKSIPINYKQICSDIKLVSGMHVATPSLRTETLLTPLTAQFEGSLSQTHLNQDSCLFSADSNLEEMTLENVMDLDDVEESLDDLLRNQSNIERESKILDLIADDDGDIESLIHLYESTRTDESALLDEDDDWVVQNSGEEFVVNENMLNKSYEVVDEDISFLVYNNSNVEDIESSMYNTSSDSVDTVNFPEHAQEMTHVVESLLLDEHEANEAACKQQIEYKSELYVDISESNVIDNHHLNDCNLQLKEGDKPHHTLDDSVDISLTINTAAEIKTDDVANKFSRNLDGENLSSDQSKASETITKDIHSKPSAETKILFCSWMKDTNKLNENEEIHPDKLTIERAIDYKGICKDIYLVSALVKVEVKEARLSVDETAIKEENVLKEEQILDDCAFLDNESETERSIARAPLDHEAVLSNEEENLLKQEFSSQINIANEDISLDLEVEEEPAPVYSRPFFSKLDEEIDTTERRGEVLKKNEVQMPSNEQDSPSSKGEELASNLGIYSGAANAEINEVIPVPQEVKIAQSFDDMFKSFLQNPKKESERSSHDIKSEISSTNSTREMKVGSGQEEPSFSQEKSKKRRGRPRKNIEKVDRRDEMKFSSPKSDKIIKMDNIPALKKQTKEIITLLDDEDDQRNAQSKNVLVNNAKILNVPGNVRYVRGNDSGVNGPMTRVPCIINKKMGSNQVLKVGVNSRQADLGAKTDSGLPRKNQPFPIRTTLNRPPHKLMNQVNVITKPQVIGFARGKQSPRSTKNIIRLSATNKIVVEPPQRTSKQIDVKYDPDIQVVQQRTRTLQQVETKIEKVNTGKRKISAESHQITKIARMESKQNKTENELKLFDFITDSILSKPEMKPYGQISNIHHCKLCTYKNSSKWDVENHIESTHSNIEVKYPCVFCDYVAKTRANYYAHRKKKHEFVMDVPQY